MATVEKVKKSKRRVDRKKLLEVLTYELVDGRPVYYRGYKEVLKGKKQPEEVMGSSTLQARIIFKLILTLSPLEEKGYILTTNEHGIKFGGNRRALDIGIFEADKLKINDEYADVPPVVAIEVDTKAEIGEGGFMEYMKRKIDDLLGFGVKRVIWIFTKGEVIVIADDPKSWKVLDWDDEFEVWEGVKVKLSELIKQR